MSAKRKTHKYAECSEDDKWLAEDGTGAFHMAGART